MRMRRLLLSVFAYAAILGALAAARFWWEFGVVATLTVVIWAGTGAVVIRSRRGARDGSAAVGGEAASADSGRKGRSRFGAMTGPERAEFIERNSWRLAPIATLVGLALIFPMTRGGPWWGLPMTGVACLLVFGFLFRWIGRWLKGYEEEFERFAKRQGRQPPGER